MKMSLKDAADEADELEAKLKKNGAIAFFKHYQKRGGIEHDGTSETK